MWLILSLKFGSCDFLWVGPGTQVTGYATNQELNDSDAILCLCYSLWLVSVYNLRVA
jgi:hypothetical protein